jgi:hypothetical protein
MKDEGFGALATLQLAPVAYFKETTILNPSSFILHPEISIARL